MRAPGELRGGEEASEHGVDETLIAGRGEGQFASTHTEPGSTVAEPHERPLAVVVEELVRVDLPGTADRRLAAEQAILDVQADIEVPAADLHREPALVVRERAGVDAGVGEREIARASRRQTPRGPLHAGHPLVPAWCYDGTS